jgi:hypothetical protein
MSIFSYPNNAQVRGDFLYVRDANGAIIAGHSVADGDYITVLDVPFPEKLKSVLYRLMRQVKNNIKKFERRVDYLGLNYSLYIEEQNRPISSHTKKVIRRS